MGLLPMLAIGLLIGVPKHIERGGDEVITLCEPDYVIKLIELCQKLKPDINHVKVGVDNPLRGSGSAEDMKNKYMKKLKGIFDRDRFKQIDTHKAKDQVYNRYNRNKPRVGHEFARRDSTMRPANPKPVMRPKPSQKHYLYSELCCISGCTKAVFRSELCFWAK